MEMLNHPKPETAHILFLDAVGYSTLPFDRQTAVFRGLQDIVNDSPTVAEAASRDEVIRTPTGDGMALAFFGNCSSALRCARELAEQIEGGFAVRMGLHTGEVVRQLDVNGNMNVSGDGINIAQRVMDFGDGGHILMSLAYATELQRAGDPAAVDCHDIGVVSAKHGMQIHLYNFAGPPSGTADVPARVRMDDRWIRPRELRLGTAGHSLVVATLQILGWLLARPWQWRTRVNQIDPRLSPNFSVIDLTGPRSGATATCAPCCSSFMSSVPHSSVFSCWPSCFLSPRARESALPRLSSPWLAWATWFQSCSVSARPLSDSSFLLSKTSCKHPPFASWPILVR